MHLTASQMAHSYFFETGAVLAGSRVYPLDFHDTYIWKRQIFLYLILR